MSQYLFRFSFTPMDERLRHAALDHHRLPRPGKIAVTPTKALTSPCELSLAHSPGVAAACEEIECDPETAALYTARANCTARANLVAVISNGTAVLGQGDIGPMLLSAAQPVHILTPTATVRRIVDIAALLSVEAAQRRR